MRRLPQTIPQARPISVSGFGRVRRRLSAGDGRWRRASALAGLLLAGAVLIFDGASAFDGAPGDDAVARGEYIARAAGCVGCHTDHKNGGVPLAGGRALKSPYGVFYSPNITPDTMHGIGDWSDDDFVRALRHGRSPSGRTYYPAFPYPAYTGMSERDMLDLKAWLFAQPPVPTENRAHGIRFPFSWRFSLYPWRWFFFGAGRHDVPIEAPAEVQRGAYLVEVLGHCGECHTPRNMVGGLKVARPFAGTRYGPEGGLVPNITPDAATGIGGWSEADLVFFFRTGLKPDGDDVTGEMREVIEDGLSRLTDGDLKAMAAYLMQLQPIENAVRRARKAAAAPVEDAWWD